jgi:hypothetical protein
LVLNPSFYNNYFKIDNITDEESNADSINLGKRASVDMQGFGDLAFEKSGKKRLETLGTNLQWKI